MLIDDCVERPARLGLPFGLMLPKIALSQWDPNGSVTRCVGSWENYVYEVVLDGVPSILRLTDSVHRTELQVNAELEWIEYLCETGLPICQPVRSLGNGLSVTVDDAGHVYVACVFVKCNGIQISPSQCRALGQTFLRRVGRLLGALHAASILYGAKRASPIDRPTLVHDDLIENARRHLESIEPSLAAELRTTLQWMQSLPTDSEFGLIHADLHGRNMFHDGESLTIIDLDDCCYGWYAYDIGVALNWAFPLDHPHREQALGYLLEGYSGARSVHIRLVDDITRFVRVRLLQDYVLTLQRMRDPHYPHDWLASRAAGLETRLNLNGSKGRAGEV